MKLNEKLTQDLRETIGDLSNLNTTDKSSIVNAINEVYGKIKFKSLLDTPVQAPNSTENYNWGTLNDDYTNYDVLLVRVTSQSNGGEGTIGVLMPNVNSSTRIHLYAMEVYQAYILVGSQNNNQIGLHAITVRGWNANGLYITSVYGIKF